MAWSIPTTRKWTEPQLRSQHIVFLDLFRWRPSYNPTNVWNQCPSALLSKQHSDATKQLRILSFRRTQKRCPECSLILIWQENCILKAFFMINILASLRGCSDGRIWPVEPQLQTPRTKVQNKAGSPPKEGFAIRSWWQDSMQNDMAVTERS